MKYKIETEVDITFKTGTISAPHATIEIMTLFRSDKVYHSRVWKDIFLVNPTVIKQLTEETQDFIAAHWAEVQEKFKDIELYVNQQKAYSTAHGWNWNHVTSPDWMTIRVTGKNVRVHYGINTPRIDFLRTDLSPNQIQPR